MDFGQPLDLFLSRMISEVLFCSVPDCCRPEVKIHKNFSVSKGGYFLLQRPLRKSFLK